MVVTVYTTLGGMWSVAYTDVLPTALVALGIAVAIARCPRRRSAGCVLDGLRRCAPGSRGVLPPLARRTGFWSIRGIVDWWDVSLMLIFGGIPWNCYFQRVLSCQTPRKARAALVASPEC